MSLSSLKQKVNYIFIAGYNKQLLKWEFHFISSTIQKCSVLWGKVS
jgi:hypothetical protein